MKIRKIEILCSAIVLLLSGWVILSRGDRTFYKYRIPSRSDHVNAMISRDRGNEGEAESDWFIMQRAFPGNDIPRAALPAMKAGMKHYSDRPFKNRSVSSGSDWTLAGPSNIGGRVTSVALDPTDRNIVYAAAASGGVWKSTDLGTTWRNIFNESFSIGSLALAPDNPDVIYVGTGEANPSSVDTYPGNGIWRSTDAGSTWTNLGLSETGHIGKIVVNPLNSNTIFVSTLGLYRSKTIDRGIYRSVDYGATWNNILFINDTTGTADLALCPSDTTILLAASWTYYRTLPSVDRGGPASGLYRSSNGGTIWTKITSGYPHDDPSIGRASLTFAPSNTSIVYSLVANGGGYNWGGVYKSTDQGITWTESYTNSVYSESQVWYNNIVTVNPTNSNIVWAGMTTLYQSTDAGATFHPAAISGPNHVDYHALEYSRADLNTVITGNDGGIYISTDGGTNWSKSLNLPITQYYAGTVSYLNPNRFMGGTQDNGSSLTRNGSDPWAFFYGGDGFYCLIDPTDSQYVYAESQYGSIGYSTNGGNSFNGGTNGLDGSEFMGWETPIAMDPQHPKTLYTGYESIYRTTNHMQSWAKISGNLTDHITNAFSTISTIDVSPIDSNVIYTGTGDGNVWVTTNGGGLWTNISTGLPLHWVTRVVADPESSNIAYVTLSGFREYDSSAHVFRTNNFGATWTNIGTTLPDIPVNDLIIDPQIRSHLYIATDMNVMYTTDGGSDWNIFGSSLPVVTVHDLAFHPNARELVAFTHGRSVYTIQVAGKGFTNQYLTLAPRWNLVSNPLQETNDSVGILFPSSGGQAFSFDSLSGYLTSSTMVPGRGYWIQNPSAFPQISHLFGNLVQAETLAVTGGWNLIGALSTPISKNNLLVVGTNIISSLFGYSNGYAPQDSLMPGFGYWVKVDRPGTIILQTGSQSAGYIPPENAGTLGRYNTLMLEDVQGNRSSLYFGKREGSDHETAFEMPPVPVGGIFDARFVSNSILALSDDHAGETVPIRISSSSFPVQVVWRVHTANSVASLILDGKEIPMTGVGAVSIRVMDQKLGLKFISTVQEPMSFALFQNYPNPFNPSTEVSFTLAEKSNVRISIYDDVGRFVTRILDGTRDAGKQSAGWNATDQHGNQVASGVYIYRLEASSLSSPGRTFVDAKRMVCIR